MEIGGEKKHFRRFKDKDQHSLPNVRFIYKDKNMDWNFLNSEYKTVS